MDGWGVAPKSPFNAIDNAKTPHFDRLIREYPNITLKSDGLSVGLPEGQVGTSEVNHLTIGAGRIIYQDLPKINKAIEDQSFYNNVVLKEIADHATKQSSAIHLIGILSDGGLHSYIKHLYALLELLDREHCERPIYIHGFTDGRDVPPISAEKYLTELEQEIAKHPKLTVSIATIQGRVFLDRDRDWAKTDVAVEALVNGKGKHFESWHAVLNTEYTMHNKDEFLNQAILDKNGSIKSGDAVFFWHYRPDRMYQLVQRLLDQKFENSYLGMFVSASEEFTTTKIAFPRNKVTDTLAETISKTGKTQLHITETEKYAHLTFFLNGERINEFEGETWRMIESNRYVKPNYNFEPSMRAFQIAQEVVEAVNTDKYDFIAINFCNTDMVGHTGNYNAAVIAAEAVDYCVGKIYEALESRLSEYALIITSDHGNADCMWDEKNNQPWTAHTASAVPFILVSDIPCKLDRKESLEDVAPTILELMSINKPAIMTGNSLVIPT
jgi:2,3-bisphosphoglycerate-independent phosphoglycerate mutase